MYLAHRPNPAGLTCDVPYPSQRPVFTRIDPDGLAPVAPEPAAATPSPVDLPSLPGLLSSSAAAFSRRACPDLRGQLQHIAAQRPAMILCNLMDDDGPPPVQAALAASFAGSILTALASLSQAASASAAICAPARTPDWLREALSPARSLGIEVKTIDTCCYPASHPSLLLPMLLGKRLGVGRLPVERGILMLDAFAAADIGFAIRNGRSMGLTPLSIGDHVRAQSHHLLVPPDMPVGQVLTILGGSAHDVTLLAGDLPAERVVSPNTPAGQCALKLHILPRRPGVSPSACTRCGQCIDHCPTGAHPAGLLEAAQQDDPDIARRAGLDACILCGICSLVCPSQLPLVRSIRTLLT